MTVETPLCAAIDISWGSPVGREGGREGGGGKEPPGGGG